MQVSSSTGAPAAPSGAPPAIAPGAAWRLAGVAARFTVAFLSVPVLTRALGMSQWGILALCQAAAAPLVLLDAGFGAASVKYVAQALGEDDRPGAVRVVHTTLLFNASVAAAGTAALALAAPWLATSAFAIPAEQVQGAIAGFRLIALGWFLGLVQSAWIGTLAAHQRYDELARLGGLAALLVAAAQVLAAWMTRDLVWVLAAQVVVSTLVVLLYRRAAARALPGAGSRPRWDWATFKRSARFGGWQAVATVGAMLSAWSDRYVLGALSPPKVVGQYAVAQSVYGQLYGTFGELGEVLFPAVSLRQGQGDLAGARRLTMLAGWTLTIAFGACAAVVAAVGGDFLHLWISPEVAREATGTLRLLCVAGIAGVAAIAPFHYVLGAGEPRWNAVSAPLLGVTVLAVSLVLVPRMGLPGVGYGLLCGTLLRWGLVALIWRAHFSGDVPLRRFAVQVWAPALSGMAVLAVLVRVHDALGRSPSWPWLLVECAGGIAVATTAQLLAAEIFPGGAARRRDVVASFRPVVTAWLPGRGRR